ncbi:hypothetical protein ACFL50_03040 [Candidatus Latescibacterota bacterium]
MHKLLLTVSVNFDNKDYSLSFDLNSIKEPLTEKIFEECCMFLLPSMRKVLRDHNKFSKTDPWALEREKLENNTKTFG